MVKFSLHFILFLNKQQRFTTKEIHWKQMNEESHWLRNFCIRHTISLLFLVSHQKRSSKCPDLFCSKRVKSRDGESFNYVLTLKVLESQKKKAQKHATLSGESSYSSDSALTASIKCNSIEVNPWLTIDWKHFFDRFDHNYSWWRSCCHCSTFKR